MTDWRPFFQILTMHRAGYRATLPLAAAVAHPDEQGMARRLHMVPLPVQPHMEPSALARQWMMEDTP